jgi:hypothetical protein
LIFAGNWHSNSLLLPTPFLWQRRMQFLFSQLSFCVEFFFSCASCNNFQHSFLWNIGKPNLHLDPQRKYGHCGYGDGNVSHLLKWTTRWWEYDRWYKYSKRCR